MHNFYPDSDDRSFLKLHKNLELLQESKRKTFQNLTFPEYIEIERKKFLSIFIAIAPVNSLSQLLIEFQYML